MYKYVVHSYVVRRYPTESTAEIVVLNSLYKQRSQIGPSLAFFAININEVKKELNKLSVSVDKLDIHCLEVLMPMHRLPCVGTNIEAADCVIVKVPNNLLLLSSKVPNNARGQRAARAQ